MERRMPAPWSKPILQNISKAQKRDYNNYSSEKTWTTASWKSTASNHNNHLQWHNCISDFILCIDRRTLEVKVHLNYLLLLLTPPLRHQYYHYLSEPLSADFEDNESISWNSEGILFYLSWFWTRAAFLRMKCGTMTVRTTVVMNLAMRLQT